MKSPNVSSYQHRFLQFPKLSVVNQCIMRKGENDMRKYGRTLALICAAALALSLAACAQHTDLKTKEDFLGAAAKVNANTSSYDVEGTVELEHKADVVTTKKTLSVNSSFFLHTKEFSSVIKTVIAGSRAIPNAESYLKTNDEGQKVLYTLADNKWTGQIVASDEDADALMAKVAGFDPAQVVGTFAEDNMEQFTIVGSDVIGGLNTSILEGNLAGEALVAFALANDCADLFEEETLKTLVTEEYSGTVNVRVWVIDSSLTPVKVRIDFTQVANDYAKAAAAQKVAGAKETETDQRIAAERTSVGKYTIVFTIKNINRATTVTVPSAGLKAHIDPAGAVTLTEQTEAPTATPAPESDESTDDAADSSSDDESTADPTTSDTPAE